MLLFIVARNRLDRYAELRRQLGSLRSVKIVLDRREGDRRVLGLTFLGIDRWRVERRQARPDFRKLGWSVVDADDGSH